MGIVGIVRSKDNNNINYTCFLLFRDAPGTSSSLTFNDWAMKVKLASIYWLYSTCSLSLLLLREIKYVYTLFNLLPRVQLLLLSSSVWDSHKIPCKKKSMIRVCSCSLPLNVSSLPQLKNIHSRCGMPYWSSLLVSSSFAVML